MMMMGPYPNGCCLISRSVVGLSLSLRQAQTPSGNQTWHWKISLQLSMFSRSNMLKCPFAEDYASCGGFLQWGYPQIINFMCGFSTINQPAIGVASWNPPASRGWAKSITIAKSHPSWQPLCWALSAARTTTTSVHRRWNLRLGYQAWRCPQNIGDAPKTSQNDSWVMFGTSFTMVYDALDISADSGLYKLVTVEHQIAVCCES